MTDIESPTFQLESVGVKATAQLRGDQFVVFKGSQARVEVVDSYEKHVTTAYKLLRATLIEQGKLRLADGVYVFTQDIAFDTSTPAAIVVTGRNDGGPKSWKRILESGLPQSYGAWLQENRAILPPSITAQLLEPVVTTWQPFFHALAHKLLEFEERQSELVQILRDAGVGIQHDEGEPLAVLDPFSFISLILKHTSFGSVQPILAALRAVFDLQAELPTDLTGVPWSNPMNAWFFAYRSNRQPDDLSILWALAHQALRGQLEADTFAAALGIRQVKLAKLTQGLFWLNPQAFLALNSVNVPYLEARGVRGAGKVQSLAEFDAVLNVALSLAPDFVTLSHSAWLDAQQSKEVAGLEGDGGFPWTAFLIDAAKHPSDHVKGNMLLDRKYAPLLLELALETAPSALKPSRSPFNGRDQFAARIGLSAAEDGTFAHALLLPVNGFDGVPLEPGLTLTIGVSESRSASLRQALRVEGASQQLLETLTRALPARLSIGAFPALPLTSERSVEIAKQLEGFAVHVESNCRFQVDLTLSPDVLQSEDFTSHLETVLRYADDLKGVLDGLTRTALPKIAAPEAIQATGVVLNEEPLGFTPLPGVPLNQILYGPPGTGKTFRVVDEALRVLEPQTLINHPGSEGRAQRKARYDALTADGQITFTTFHQSFGYEDFIEGIKPVMRDGQLHYELEDGLFLQAVRAAGGRLAGTHVSAGQGTHVSAGQGDGATPVAPRGTATEGVNLAGQVWRIYIDGTVPVSQVRTRSLERNEIRVGSWLTGMLTLDGRPPVMRKSPVDLNILPEDELNAQQLAFKDAVRIGDLVLLATRQDEIGAVGVVTGEYRFDPSEAIFATEYAHARSVRWLASGLHWKASQMFGKAFSNSTLQRVANLKPPQVLSHLNNSSQPATPPTSSLRPHVLIIDEINRGNVAKIFGELITLLEPSKRAGAAEGLTVRLPLSKREFSVPQSLYILGTMNTADRSLTSLDAALRRRFVFHPVWPEPSILPVIDLDGTALDLPAFLSAINQRIERLLSREQVIGHAYLLDIPASLSGVAQALQQRILPLLEEYFFEDWGLIRQVLGDDQKPSEQQFICEKPSGATKRFERNPRAFENIEAFVRVYSGASDLSGD